MPRLVSRLVSRRVSRRVSRKRRGVTGRGVTERGVTRRGATGVLALLLGLSSTSARGEEGAAPPASSVSSSVSEAPSPPLSAAPRRVLRFTLEECLRAALEHGPEIVQKRHDVRIAEERRAQAYSGLAPRVWLQPQAVSQTPLVDFEDDLGAILSSLPLGGGVSSPGSNIPRPSLSGLSVFPSEIAQASVNLQMPLFAGGKIWSGIQLAETNVRLEEALLVEVDQRTAYQVRQLHLGVLAGEASLALLGEMRGELARILDDTRRMLARGFVTEADVLEAEANLAELESEIESARANLVAAKESLRFLMGLPADVEIELVERLEALPGVAEELSVDALVERALSARPELRARKIQHQLAEQQVWLKRGDLPFVPTLALQLEGGVRGTKLPFVQTNWSKEFGPYYQAALVLKVPLFDGVDAIAKVQEASLQARKAELGVEQTAALVVTEVRRRHAAVAARLRALEAAEKVARAREERYRNAEKSHQLETLGRAELLGEHLAWVQARAKRLSALYQLHLARLEVDLATGDLPSSGSASPTAPPRVSVESSTP